MNKIYQIMFKKDNDTYSNYYDKIDDTINFIAYLYIHKDLETKDIQLSKKINGKYYVYSDEELINFVIKHLDYEKLVKELKEDFKNKDIKSANSKYEKMGLICNLKLDLYRDDDKEHFEIFTEYNSYINMLSNEELYTITDYGKEQAYKEMEQKKEYYTLKELTNNDLLGKLDNFMNFYEWEIIKSDKQDKYNINDLQTNELVSAYINDKEEYDLTLTQVIDRVIGTALDYELDSERFEDSEYLTDEDLQYYKDLLEIGKQYSNDKEWLEYKQEQLDNIIENNNKWLCVKCGKVKEEYETMYCDECFEEIGSIEITISNEEIKDLIYDTENEFINENDEFDYNGRELTDDDLDMIDYAISCFSNKIQAKIDDLFTEKRDENIMGGNV